MPRLAVYFVHAASLTVAWTLLAQRNTEESFIPSYSAASLHYLWGSRADLDDPPGRSMAQHELGVLAQYPVVMQEDSRLTTGLRFRWNLLDFGGNPFAGQDSLDLYRIQIPVNFWHSFNDQWKLWAGIEPGVFSDLESITWDDFTTSALIVGAYEWRPDWTVSFGGYYSRDLGDDRLLPVLGVIWRPNRHWNLSATFPRLRVAFAPDERTIFDLTMRPGGSGWNIQNARGRDLDFEYKSWRVSLGIERILTEEILGRIYGFAEVGLGFGQELTLRDGDREVYSADMDEIITLSAGLRLRF